MQAVFVCAGSGKGCARCAKIRDEPEGCGSIPGISGDQSANRTTELVRRRKKKK